MMRSQRMTAWAASISIFVCLQAAAAAEPAQTPPSPMQAAAERAMFKLLDAPLLFVKRHSYTGIHIYDTYYKWPPGGGGIYVLENPQAPKAEWKIRPVIDPTTPGTLGLGVYTHPELSWDATKLLFCFKGEPTGSTSIYEIGIDGKGLRRLTDPTPSCDCYKGSHGGQHDVAPAYLPDGRIVFLSTRPSGLVPCNNTGVAILHRMNADGSDMHPISVNNVNEFDPSVMPDGRVLFGRWEYIDKNALTIQSLWSVNPDGTQETAVYANNMVFPEAVLDARPVPNSHLVVATFAKHNSTPRGSIAMLDPRRGKNEPKAATNFEHPEDPTFDRGDSCEPWPLSEDVVLFSGRPAGQKRNIIELIDRSGHRATVLSDPEICLHAPMLVKPQARPQTIVDSIDRRAKTGRLFVQDIYRGLDGVKRGEIKSLRVIEETSRISPTLMGGSPYNQVFLVSCALAFSVKNYLGVVPVDPDGSAYFEVPSGRALYLQALDADGRLVQGMRTFVQAAPGTTRSCIGCHEHKYSTAANTGPRDLLGRAPHRPQPESWGSGFVDYPSMVQPILDKHCVSCHGGEKDIAAGMDLTGGWTEHFSISYENLTSRRQTQLVAYWIAGIDCMNGTAFGSAPLFPPRSFGSGAAPLAKVLMSGHSGYLPNLSRKERDLLMAWIDTNGLYHGTWDQTEHGCAVRNWNQTRSALTAQMQTAGCVKCHGEGNRVAYFESDWINLKDPQLSRILRAPMAKGDGLGLGLCRNRKVDPRRQRIRLLVNGYAHAVQPVDAFAPQPIITPDLSGQPVVSFASANDPNYQAMLAILGDARETALATPRVDMPGAQVLAGTCRTFNPPPLPEVATPLAATLNEDGLVHLRTERSARTIGLEAEFHRSEQEVFQPTEKTLLERTALFHHTDHSARTGKQCYALVLVSGQQRSLPLYATVTVPPPSPPSSPTGLKAVPASGAIRLAWQTPRRALAGYHVYRAKAGAQQWVKITEEPVRETSYTDAGVEIQVPYSYAVRAISLRGAESEPTPPLTASATIIKEPVFVPLFQGKPGGQLYGEKTLPGKLHGSARCDGGVLDLQRGGHLTFPHHTHFDLGVPMSLECRVFFQEPGEMPVIVSCGSWKQAGWFLQRLGNIFRWHMGGIDCDGGRPAVGKWIHLVGTYDGRVLRLFQDGAKVAEVAGRINPVVWPCELHLGQYSAQPSPPYQVTGRITGVKLYHRPLDAAEAAAAAAVPPPGAR